MYSIVIPVYKNEQTLHQLLDRLCNMHAELDGLLEAVFVVDGSPDSSYALLHAELPARPFQWQLIALSRNFGSFAAIRMGLLSAKGPYYAVMAADLQEPAELVLDFFTSLSKEPVDIVMGVRVSRDEPLLSRLASSLFWVTFRRFVQQTMPEGGIDVFGCTQQVRDVIVRMEEANSTLVGLLVWLGFRRKLIPYQRLARSVGKSGWTFRRKMRYMLDSMYAFSDLPIVVLTSIGFLGVLSSVLASIVVATAWLAGLITVKGYTPLILAVLLSTSLILLSMGVLGGYIWRAFENTKNRPLYIPMLHESNSMDSRKVKP